MPMLLACLVALLPQAPQNDDVPGLLRKLNADRAEERDDAFRRLLDLGESVRKALEEASRAPDVEAAQRAREIVKRLDFRAQLGPKLLKGMPDLDRRLSGGNARAWTEAFLELTDQRSGVRRFPDLGTDEFDRLAAAAVRGAMSQDGSLHTVLQRVQAWNLRSAIPELVEMLPGADSNLLHFLSEALAILEAKEAVPIAAERLEKETDNQKPFGWTRILLAVGNREAVQGLLRRVRKERFGISGWIVQEVSGCDAEDFIPELVALLDVEEPVMDGGLGRTLGHLNARKALPLVRERIEKGPERTRWAATNTLCEFRHPDAIPDLLALVKGGDRNTQMTAISALGQLEHPAIEATIRPFLKQADPGMRITAVRVLAIRRDPEALPVLREFAKDRQLANDTVGYLGFYDFKEVSEELITLMNSKGAGAIAAQSVLARRGNPDALKAMEGQLKDKNEWSRRNAATVLASSGKKDVVALLRPLLQDPADAVPGEVAIQLGKLGGREALDALLAEAKNPKSRARYGAIRGLGLLRAPEGVAVLNEILERGEPALRQEALTALLQHDLPELMPKWKTLLTDDDSRVRFLAAQGLTRLGAREGVPLILKTKASLFYLNAVRKPEAWKKLAAVRFEPPLEMWDLRGLKTFAEHCGLKLDPHPDYGGMGHLNLYGARSAIEALQWTDFILEEDRLRLLPRSQALRFWREWWDREGKR